MYGKRDGADYQAVRTAGVKLRGVGSVQKLSLSATVRLCYSATLSGGNNVPMIL